MPRLVALVLLVAVVTLLAASALAAGAPAPPPSGILPPTAPDGDFNRSGQSSSWIITALHVRGPEKIIGAAVVLLLLVSLVMFAAMLRQVYGGESPPRR